MGSYIRSLMSLMDWVAHVCFRTIVIWEEKANVDNDDDDDDEEMKMMVC